MKKISFILCAAAVALATTFTSCSNEDNSVAAPGEVLIRNGNDLVEIIAQLAEKATDSTIVVNLPAGVELKATDTVAAPAGFALTIKGAEGKPAIINLSKVGFIIDNSLRLENVILNAAKVETPLIQLNKNTDAAKPGLRTETKSIETLLLKNVEANNVKHALVYGNRQNYVIADLTIDNALIQMENADKDANDNAVISLFNQYSGVKDLTIKNSTIYNTAKGDERPTYFERYGNSADVKNYGYADDVNWYFTYENNTFYNVNNGNWANHTRTNSVIGRVVLTVKKNIWVDCGNSQSVQRLANQQALTRFNDETVIEENTFFKDGKSVDQSKYDDKQLKTDPAFKDVEEGDFTPTGAEQVEKRAGDPRWL